MRFGVREICDVVMRAKSTQRIGNKVFYKHEPVIYFDSLKTSTLEGGSTTVYATGGRGNARLMSWEGERTLTFTMEDALLSPVSFMILSGAGLIDATDEKPIQVHVTEHTDDFAVEGDVVTVYVEQPPYAGPTQELAKKDKYVYIMLTDENGEVSSEPYLGTPVGTWDNVKNMFTATPVTEGDKTKYAIEIKAITSGDYKYTPTELTKFVSGKTNLVVDYYTEKKTNQAQQIEITPESFGGNFYLEASTLFRDTNGTDLPAEFIIPNCKVQSNFTFSMSSSGDPSTFTFTMDAFPGYTRFNESKKVLAAIQVITETIADEDLTIREQTPSDDLGKLED